MPMSQFHAVCACPYTDPKILLLNIELELKSEKENAEVGRGSDHRNSLRLTTHAAWLLV